jgi:hypothetical protein
MSALSSSGSFRASWSTLSAVDVMSGSYQQEPEPPSAAPNKPLDPAAAPPRASQRGSAAPRWTALPKREMRWPNP